MSGWLREWSASAPPSTEPSPTTARSLTTAPATNALSPATAGPSTVPSREAEDAIRGLIAHQQGAIELAQREQAGGANPAALAFARQIVESRTEEIAQLRACLG